LKGPSSKIRKKCEKTFHEVESSKFKKFDNDEKRRFRRSKVKVQKIRKNDEKRRFRRSKFNKSEKMMKKDVSGGQSSKNPKK
jgi:hypothetical protein